MTDKEKLQKALEALKNIATNGNPLSTVISQRQFAAKVYAELTAPARKIETGWLNIYPDGQTVTPLYPTKEAADANACGNRVDCVEITYSRPIEEKEEVWEGKIDKILTNGGYDGFPSAWFGQLVEVRLKGE